MTPEQYVTHARTVLNFTEDKIARNRYAIESGRFYLVQDALKGNEERSNKQILAQSKTDEEKADWKARRSHFTTRYLKKWLKKNGENIVMSEYRDQRGNLHDVLGGWDVLSYRGKKPRVWQAFTPGKEKEHLRKLTENGAIAKAEAFGAAMWFVEFERGNEKPVKCYRVAL